MELEKEIQTLVRAFEDFLISHSMQQTYILREEIRKAVSSIQDEEKEELMKIKDVAKELRVSEATISVWLKQGKIKGHYLSNRLFFFRREIYASIRNEPSLEKYARQQQKKRKANRS